MEKIYGEKNIILPEELVIPEIDDKRLAELYKKLSKEYIEAIAGQWKRLNIETVKEAMDICRKEHKKVSKTCS